MNKPCWARRGRFVPRGTSPTCLHGVAQHAAQCTVKRGILLRREEVLFLFLFLLFLFLSLGLELSTEFWTRRARHGDKHSIDGAALFFYFGLSQSTGWARNARIAGSLVSNCAVHATGLVHLSRRSWW